MTRKFTTAILLAAGLVLSATLASAQDREALEAEIKELRQGLDAFRLRQSELHEKNTALKERLAHTEVEGDAIERMVNALGDTEFAQAVAVESGANPIRVSGDFRVRSGYTFDRDFGRGTVVVIPGQGDVKLDDRDDDGSFIDARFRLGFDFALDRDVHARLSLQANGLYDNGDTPGNRFGVSESDSDASFGRALDTVEVYEAWIQVDNLFGISSSNVRAGRQEIVLGNEFQFGNNDFFSGETFDAIHWTRDCDAFALHLIWAKLAINNSFNTRGHSYPTQDNGHDDDELFSVYFTFKGLDNHEIDLYWIYLNGHNGETLGTLGNSLGTVALGNVGPDPLSGNFYIHTVGGRIGGEFPGIAAGLDWNLEVAYQFGSDIDLGLIEVDVDGFAIEFEVGLTLDSDSNFRVFLRFLWASGGDLEDRESGYIPLFPERHAQAGSGGARDYRARYGILNIIPMENVITLQVGLTFEPAPNWTVGATALYAVNDEDVPVRAIDGNVFDEDNIGFEVDVFAEYRYSSQTTFSAGIGVFFPEEAAPVDVPGAFTFVGSFAGKADDIAFLFYLQTEVAF